MIARRVLAKYQAMQPVAMAAIARIVEPPFVGLQEIVPLLSGREQEVLEMIARGFSYIEISKLQSISVHTVQTHIKSLYRKLAVHSKNEAVFEATKLGLL